MAAVMMGAAGLTGCSNESVVEEQAPVNPTYNGESVKTQFAINIPYANPSKRMTGDNTQQSGQTFLGMSNIRLIPYANGTSWDGTISKILALGDIASDNGVSNSSGVGTHETQKTYNDVEIPVGTSNFLFYAEGTQTPGVDVEKNYGSLIANVDGAATRGNINFTLEDIYTVTGFGDTQDALIALLNAVEDAQITNGGTGSQTITWASYGSQASPSGNALTLKNLYNSYTEMKAGSANSILMLMQALYTEVDKFDDAATDEGKVAARIKELITTQVTSNTASLQLNDGGSGTLAMTFTCPSGTDVSKFPNNLGLPDGAVRVKLDGDAFVSDNFTLEVGGSSGLKIDDITYPASLYYFVDSDLKASTDATATFPTNGSWGTEGTWSGFPQTTVDATTRVIAMKEPVQYGVGLLATTVKCSAASLPDNGGNSINIGTGFTFNGVLIGGQPDDVKWNMLQAYNAGGSYARTKTIYDAAVTGTVTTAVMSTPNYTLALDNSKFTDDQGTRADANNQDKVNIAIELVNNTGNNFEGADGMIYNGATFYMVAQLDPSDASLNNTTDKKSVFMQDYKTTANLTIKSLKGAYNVIPDLRSTNLTFGLAVDLDWEEGLTFEVDIE